LGTKGEWAAWDYLLGQGYEMIEKNYRCPLGEIDVVARKGDRLCFVEIKTRRSHRFGRPEEAVDFRKQKKLIRLAEWYLKKRTGPPSMISFDVLAVTWRKGDKPEFRLIENAFTADVS